MSRGASRADVEASLPRVGAEGTLERGGPSEGVCRYWVLEGSGASGDAPCEWFVAR